MYLKREQILAVSDLPSVDVDVPEWGGSVRVQGLTVAGKEQLERFAVESGKMGFLQLKTEIVVLSVVDEHGQPLFTPEDVAMLREKSAPVMERIFKAAMQLNGLSKSAREDAEKN